MNPKVSIIFPTFNGWQDTKECLESVSKLDYPKEKIEVIIVDNASTDGTVENIKYQISVKKLNIYFIINPKNLGFAKAINQGLKKAKGDYLLVTNNDVVFDKNFLTVLVDYMERNPQVGVAGGKIYFQKPKNKLLFTGVIFNPWLGSIISLPKPNCEKETQWIQGCAMFIRKAVIKKVGLFDTEYFYTFEDYDFCQRARRAGFKIIYYPKAIAWHKEGGTIDKQGHRKKAFELYKAKFYFIFRNCSLPQIITSTLVQFLLVAPYRKLIKRDRYFFVRPLIAGFFYNLTKLPEIIKNRKEFK